MQNRSFSRRSFLKLTGLSLGVGVTSGMSVEAAEAAANPLTEDETLRDTMLTLHVLVPDSAHPIIGEALVKGFAGSTPASAWPVTVALHTYRDAQSESVLRILKEPSQTPVVVVGSALGLDALEPLFRDAGRVMIATGMGATIPRHNERLASTVSAYWPHWQTEWAIGTWAARTLGRRAVIGAAAYESGYDSAYAFWAGFEYAGGTVVDHVVTHFSTNSGITALVDAVKAARPDVIYGAVSGVSANDVLGAWRNGWSKHGHHLVLNSAFLGTGGVTPTWAAGAIVAQPRLASFMMTQSSRWGQVGIGVRHGLNLAAEALRGDFTRMDAVQQALREAFATTGLGDQTTIPATTIATIQPSRAGIRLNQQAQLATTSADVEPLQSLQETLRTGWIGPYLA